jgi:hypothetical protein
VCARLKAKESLESSRSVHDTGSRERASLLRVRPPIANVNSTQSSDPSTGAAYRRGIPFDQDESKTDGVEEELEAR